MTSCQGAAAELTDTEGELLASLPRGQFIGGRWRSDASCQSFTVRDPATGAVLAEVASASDADVDDALTAAASSQDAFASMSPRGRADILWRAHDDLVHRAGAFALLITLEMGKPLAESVAEVHYAADFLRWFAEQAPRAAGETRLLPDGTSRMLVVPRPVGPCVLITPWNFPIAMAARKLAPAIAAGCTSIIKPAEDTPLTTLLFAEVLQRAGMPAGSVNVLTAAHPAETVLRLLSDRRVRKLSFTGSTAVGQLLLRQAADNVLRTSMELGGNAPFLVFDDADLVAAADGFVVAKLRNGGQACTAANRLYVHEDVAAEFLALLRARFAAVRVGRGTDERVTLGPLINDAARQRVEDWLAEAMLGGAQVVVSGPAAPSGGQFLAPAVLSEVPDTAHLCVDEVFAPVIGIRTFRDEQAVVREANTTDYGLVAYAYTRDIDRAMRLISSLEYGMVGLNRGIVSNAAAPFGGIKRSGLGREGSCEGLREYQDIVYAALNA